ncbi:hypothetical protein [Streptomyces uncialis]|uniref:Uncharacterized protein n=1 Tax=Streptomyces uncialis TaxID=1048205 RepID=A0A1Q4UYS9_9ACTN|nr:hypothetical protein [Streptomyces uncialis]OKH90772.1 hypothetical protein AB852_34455 [Streptomyces uncialis]
MESAPIVVHRPSPSGGRRVNAHRNGRDETLDLAFSDRDLVVFLEAAGVTGPELILDDPAWVEWRDAGTHQWTAG